MVRLIRNVDASSDDAILGGGDAIVDLVGSCWVGERGSCRAWRDIRRLPAAPDERTLGAAMRRLHSALNEDAGRVLLAADVPAWLNQRPQYQAHAAALQDFHQRSSQHFFAAPADAPPNLADHTQRMRHLPRALAQSEARA